MNCLPVLNDKLSKLWARTSYQPGVAHAQIKYDCRVVPLSSQ
jgi:hypothetical protein